MRPLCLLGLLVLSAFPVRAQQTERRLNALREQISAAETQVRQARTQEQTALRALEGMQTEISLREQLVDGYRGQVTGLRGEAAGLGRSIGGLEREVASAKQAYRERVVHAYKHGRQSSLGLLLSSGSVTQALARARYLQMFARRRRRQVDRIETRTAELRAQEAAMQSALEQAQRLLMEGEVENQRLAARRAERESLVAELRGQRGRLERDLAQRRTDAQALEGVIREIAAAERRREEARLAAEAAREAERQRQAAIAQAEAARRAESQRRADEAARRVAEERTARRQPEPRAAEPAPAPRTLPAAPPASPPVAAAPPRTAPTPRAAPPPRAAPTAPAPRPAAPPAATPAPSAPAPSAPVASTAAPSAPAEPAENLRVDLTGSFRQNRGRLPWPADGSITGAFGPRRDPVYGTTIDAIGVDIATRGGAPVRSVFEGTVERVDANPTYGTFAIVSHGGFTTFYGNLSQVVVRSGQRLAAGQVLGRAGTADARRGAALFFAVFEGERAVNPTLWLRGR